MAIHGRLTRPRFWANNRLDNHIRRNDENHSHNRIVSQFPSSYIAHVSASFALKCPDYSASGRPDFLLPFSACRICFPDGNLVTSSGILQRGWGLLTSNPHSDVQQQRKTSLSTAKNAGEFLYILSEKGGY
jgi:hypothetical protein